MGKQKKRWLRGTSAFAKATASNVGCNPTVVRRRRRIHRSGVGTVEAVARTIVGGTSGQYGLDCVSWEHHGTSWTGVFQVLRTQFDDKTINGSGFIVKIQVFFLQAGFTSYSGTAFSTPDTVTEGTSPRPPLNCPSIWNVKVAPICSSLTYVNSNVPSTA